MANSFHDVVCNNCNSDDVKLRCWLDRDHTRGKFQCNECGEVFVADLDFEGGFMRYVRSNNDNSAPRTTTSVTRTTITEETLTNRDFNIPNDGNVGVEIGGTVTEYPAETAQDMIEQFNANGYVVEAVTERHYVVRPKPQTKGF